LKIKIEKKNSRDRYITQQKNNKKVTKYNSQNILILKYKIKKKIELSKGEAREKNFNKIKTQNIILVNNVL
jgi:hypothetical protein